MFASKQYSEPNGELTVAGWGCVRCDKELEEPPSPVLRKVNLKIISDQKCANLYGNSKDGTIYRSFICANSPEKSACNMDSVLSGISINKYQSSIADSRTDDCVKSISSTLFKMLYLCETVVTENLRIVHYKNVTLSSCGLNEFSAKPAQKKCFEWHQSIIDEQKELRNIQFGRYAENGEFPYVVMLMYRGTAFCTGSIINANWIITSAHCLSASISEIHIYAGITDFPNRDTPYFIAEQIFKHENYTENPYTNDFALIKLQKQINININQSNGICLPAYGMFIWDKQMASVIGWGSVLDNESNRVRLKMTPIILDNPYFKDNEFIRSKEIKYGQTCGGDSGAPLIQYVNGRAVVIGISTSSNRDENQSCGSPTTITFTAVNKYLNWILKTIKTNK